MKNASVSIGILLTDSPRLFQKQNVSAFSDVTFGLLYNNNNNILGIIISKDIKKNVKHQQLLRKNIHH